MRLGDSGPYNALKVDVWSLGATIWELAQAEPPFSDLTDPRQFGDQWPELSQPEIYSRSFHDFLNLCSKPSSSRPEPHELLNVSSLYPPFPCATAHFCRRHPLYATPVGARPSRTCWATVGRSRSACPGGRAPTRRGRCRGHSITYSLYTPPG